MSHKKAGGSSRNGRDSNAQRRGIKKYAGELVIPGNILVRQCGTKVHPGEHVGMGRDYTLFALTQGRVAYKNKGKTKKTVYIIPELEAPAVSNA